MGIGHSIAVVGLGYVGLPLAVALAREYSWGSRHWARAASIWSARWLTAPTASLPARTSQRCSSRGEHSRTSGACGAAGASSA